MIKIGTGYVNAILNICLFVECPHCAADIDLMQMDHDWEYFFSKCIFNTDEYNIQGTEIECPECEKCFVIGKIDEH